MRGGRSATRRSRLCLSGSISMAGSRSGSPMGGVKRSCDASPPLAALGHCFLSLWASAPRKVPDVARDVAGGVGGVEEARGRERVGGARVEADEELHALLKRAATLMVKAGYRSYSVTIEVAGKEKRYGLMESSLFLDIVMKHRNPPQKATAPAP